MTEAEALEVLTCYFTDCEGMDELSAMLRATEAVKLMFSEECKGS